MWRKCQESAQDNLLPVTAAGVGICPNVREYRSIGQSLQFFNSITRVVLWEV